MTRARLRNRRPAMTDCTHWPPENGRSTRACAAVEAELGEQRRVAPWWDAHENQKAATEPGTNRGAIPSQTADTATKAGKAELFVE